MNQFFIFEDYWIVIVYRNNYFMLLLFCDINFRELSSIELHNIVELLWPLRLNWYCLRHCILWIWIWKRVILRLRYHKEGNQFLSCKKIYQLFFHIEESLISSLLSLQLRKLEKIFCLDNTQIIEIIEIIIRHTKWLS